MTFPELMLVFPRLRTLASLFVLCSLTYSLAIEAQAIESDLPDAGLSSPGLSSSTLPGYGLSNYGLGVKAYQQGEFRRAFDAWSLGAYEGDIEAQYNLGVLYLEGRGVERNLDQARNWFLKAARKQHLEAQYNLGHMALSGMGMEKDVNVALKWWQQAAQGGYAQAQFNYGRALYLGVGGHQDKQAGLELVRAAALQHEERAQKFLDQNTSPQVRQSEPVAAAIGEQMPVDDSDMGKKQAQTSRKEISPAKIEKRLPEEQEYKTVREKLNIVSDRAEVRKDYFLRTVTQAVPVYAMPDLSRQLDTLRPRTLVKVLGMEADRLKIEVITGLLVWAKKDGLEIREGDAKALQRGLNMYQSPGGTSLGELPQNMELQILEMQGEWLKMSVPQQIYGWINARSLAYSGESNQQLRTQWAQQLSVLNGHLYSSDGVDTPKVIDLSDQAKQEPQETTSKSIPVIPISRPKPLEISIPEINDNTWLFTQIPGAYVVHVFTLLDQAKALEIAAKPRYSGQAKLYTTQVKNQTWSFMLLGPYADVDAAKSARERLPAYLAKDARIRSVALIAENRCKKRFQLRADEARGLDAYCLE